VLAGDLVVARLAGLLLRAGRGAAGPAGEPPEESAGRGGSGLRRGLGDETLLGGLLADAHALPDLGPRRPGPAGLVDEVADEMVGELAELFGGEHGGREMLQGMPVRMRGLHVVDEVVQACGKLIHASTLG
jgi:hypothetical protein